MKPLAKKCVRVDVTSQQLGKMRQEVFCNRQLSGQERRRAVKKITPLPTDGTRVDLYCDGDFVGTV